MKPIYTGIALLWWTTTVLFAKAPDVYAPVGNTKSCQRHIDAVLKEAYAHYPSITASQKLMLSAQAQIEGAKWNYFPTPSVDVSQGEQGRRGETYRLDQPIWTGGKLDALSDLAYARGDEASYTVQESGYDLANRVLGIFQVLIQADGEIKAFEHGLNDLHDLAKMLKRRVNAGVSSESDEALIQSRIFQVEGDLITAKRRYEMARSQLELLTGKPMRCGISFKKDPHLSKRLDYSRLERALVQTHPTLKKMDAQIAIAKAEKQQADAAVMPDVSLRAEHQRGSLYTNDPVNNETITYVAVSFNPGAGLSALSEIESAKYKVMQAQDQKLTKVFELKDQLVRDFADYTAALHRLESVKQTIASSQEVLESYKRLFLAGKRQWLDLVNSSRDVTQNYTALASLRAQLIVSAYRLALESGKIHFPAYKGMKR
ncbi:MAG: TolC family protein [Sulfurovum sp.]|nr:TolC family protein [Sulfurovum sp.]